ncbi:type I glyceraldehyde-3-phosphate dehydrogenase [Helicobacter monodelphidis]|uniref:type I glyceraldehyde-3-phosphate dehydrogenase n=1 Tax=Helicobacter sp. 15-1451 TaxID=2004995 RepID=UPI000DCC1785|nr:type I glyceraldehyde-3-phosphate dehydrogenase [Helicobacter sp. 15-1451]RAX58016.1 type I glyceraldehyde-3-phosphate dehydrogenase [Helicobacter sp. 15-1451]
MATLKIAINGCGRIGRALVSLVHQSTDLQLVGINDIMPIEMLAYALSHDSVHQRNLKVQVKNNQLFIQDNPIIYTQKKNPQEIDFGEVDVLIESSGLFLHSDILQSHLKKGVKKVIISAPATDNTPTFVLGVNHHLYQGESIISNASCTTNCLAPIAMLLDEAYEINCGTITTIHSYTNDQKILDHTHHTDFRRSRAAAINIIPTTTGAAKALCVVLPNLKGKLHGHSVRVPVPNVSMLDLNVRLHSKVNADDINTMLEEASLTRLKGILSIDSHYGVSSDFYNNPHSCIIAKDLTFVIADNMLKIMAWYDNEWGYSNRLLEMSRWISH